MKLEIKKVKRCRNGAYGNFLLRGHNSALITVSMALNTTLAEYAATLLHELIHAYCTLLRIEGFRVSNKREHQWIYALENEAIRTMKIHLKRG